MFDVKASSVGALTRAPVGRFPEWRIFDFLPTGVCIATPAGRIVYANVRLHDMLGYACGELEGKDVTLLCGERAPSAPVRPAGAPDGDERHYRCRNGKCVRVIESVSTVQGSDDAAYDLRTVTMIPPVADAHADGDRRGEPGTGHDAAEDQAGEARLQAILEQSPVGVSVSRRGDGIVIFANSRFAELVGLPRERIIGSKARDYYVDDEQRGRVVTRLKASGSVLNMEVQFRRADGSAFWTLFTVNQAVIQGLPVNLAWIYDYTERRNMEEALRDMASKDPLTGIYNRRSFMELARQQLARSHRFKEPMSVVVLDVDHFKRINDTYGHAIGDDALRMVAGACTSSLREYDIFGRLGGEEFVAALPGTTVDESCAVAERLRRNIARMTLPGLEGRINLTASIGIAGIEGAGDTLEKAIHRADLALYRAKNEGRNRVVVYQSGM